MHQIPSLRDQKVKTKEPTPAVAVLWAREAGRIRTFLRPAAWAVWAAGWNQLPHSSFLTSDFNHSILLLKSVGSLGLLIPTS